MLRAIVRKEGDTIMKRLSTTLFSVSVAAAVVCAAVVPSLAHAAVFPPRSPQVAFCTPSLGSYFTSVGESINPAADQLDAQVWTTSISGNATFTLMLELAGNANSNAIGVYNTGGPPVPPLFQVFPGAATAGWYATAHFAGGNLVVSLFDNNAVYQGNSNYAGVNANGFGFYLQGPGGTFYSQDTRNGGNAQMVTYAGTGVNFGDWWLCIEDLPYQYPNCLTDYEDAILLLQSVVPTDTKANTWGRVKAAYR